MASSSASKPLVQKIRGKKKMPNKKSLVWWGVTLALIIGGAVLSFPSFFSFQIHQEQEIVTPTIKPFPVSVNPQGRSINENAEVDAFFTNENPSISTASIKAKGILGTIASIIASVPGYALVGAAGMQFVTIYPGYRQEEVARAFGKTLDWSKEERAEFLTHTNTEAPTLGEGKFAPGTYEVNNGDDLEAIKRTLDERFHNTILSRYATSTAEIVPLETALTIASLLERETSDADEMRIISGIIWNRIWSDMNLQIDATLQYAKSSASKGKNDIWWPKVVPKDKYIKSSYNTYLNAGLPPGPISNPSVAAVVAALNPKKTDCFFYFHDKKGGFHCTATYKEHVTLLKQYYGQGK